ncbi:MAG: phosphotransferase [archaeon]
MRVKAVSRKSNYPKKGFRLTGNTDLNNRAVYLVPGNRAKGTKTRKMTREESVQRAADIMTVSREWSEHGFPVQRATKQEGEWLHQEYIRGPTLRRIYRKKRATNTQRRDVVRSLAEVVANMHGLHPPSFAKLPRHVDTMKEIERKAHYFLQHAMIEGYFTKRQAEKIWARFVQTRPKKGEYVVTHGDMQPGNILYVRGKPELIDLDPQRIFKDLDVARTMHKMNWRSHHRRLFLTEYNRNGGKMTNENDLPFWDAYLQLQRIRINDRELDKGASSPYHGFRLAERRTRMIKRLIYWGETGEGVPTR